MVCFSAICWSDLTFSLFHNTCKSILSYTPTYSSNLSIFIWRAIYYTFSTSSEETVSSSIPYNLQLSLQFSEITFTMYIFSYLECSLSYSSLYHDSKLFNTTFLESTSYPSKHCHTSYCLSLPKPIFLLSPTQSLVITANGTTIDAQHTTCESKSVALVALT